jgi:hypothetical protein
MKIKIAVSILLMGIVFISAYAFIKKASFSSPKQIQITEYSSETANIFLPPPDPFELIKDKTFWDKDHSKYRIYFNNNGTGKLQFFSNAYENRTGDIKNFKWTIEDKIICFNFTNVASQNSCRLYDIYYSTARTKKVYNNTLILQDPLYGEEYITLDRQYNANQLVKPQYATQVKSIYSRMQMIQSTMYKRELDFSTLGYRENMTVYLKKYLNMAFNRIFSHLNKDTLIQKNGSYTQVIPLKSKNFKTKGNWWVFEKMFFCYGFGHLPLQEKRSAICLTILPNDWMFEPEGGFVIQNTDGFTIKIPADNFIDLNAYSQPELFK